MSLPILRTTENAFAACALSASVSASLGLTMGNGIYTGIDNTDKVAPCVVCFAESATEDFPFSAIHHVKTHVVVKQMAFDQSNTSSLADTIFGAMMFDSTGSNATKTVLNRYPGYFVYDYFIESTSDSVSDDAWIQEYVFDVVSALT